MGQGWRKRLTDIFIAALVLGPALLVCGLLMIAIRIESGAPGLFVQWRVGAGGREFRLLKLRTMRAGTPDLPSHEVGAGAITPLGRLLRRSKLDELPQVLNVLAGQMSFVGPRPCLPTQRALVDERARHGLLALRPGITGPGQIMGVDMAQPARLAALEAEYFASAGLADDLRLLWRTAWGRGHGDAAVTR